MASITNDCIEIQGITEKFLINDLKIDIVPNNHGHAFLNIRMVDNGRAENLLKDMEETMITISSTAKDNTGILFKGYMTGCIISPQIDGETAEIELTTATIKLDKNRKSCSFQEKEKKYSDIINETASEGSGVCTYYDKRIKNKQIKKPVIRYMETEWEFAKRLASRYWLQVVPDETADKPTFSIGLEEKGTAPERGFFKREHKRFVKAGMYVCRKIRDEENDIAAESYNGAELRGFNNYKVGMRTSFNGKSMVICSKRARMEGAQIVFTYVLGSKELFSAAPEYNIKMHGKCFEGKVVKCENERVKIQLDIDAESGNIKSEDKLYWFNWQPETGNLMYCMPEKDTVVSLYVGGTDEGDAIVINSLRKEKGRNIDRPSKRYLTSLDKKRMFLKQKEMGFSNEDKDGGKTHFKLKDDSEIKFRTEKAVNIKAEGKIEITAEKVEAEGKKAVNLVRKSTGINIDKKINIKAKMTYMGFGAGVPKKPDKAKKLKLKNKLRDNLSEVNEKSMTSGKIGLQSDTIKKQKTPFVQLSPKQKKLLKEKLKNRTITREEYRHLEWNRRFENRRRRGINRFWAKEKEKLKNGEPGTRNWSEKQRDDILNGKVPKYKGEPVEGHHKYNATDYPHLADNPDNIYPATPNEHFERWHGGNYQNSTNGKPNNINFKEEF